jgi:hypothetical protein
MDDLGYYARRGVAITLACVLTGYGAWLSWCHFQSSLGPLVAISAAVLLVIAEHAWRHSKRRALLLGFLGVAAAGISATVVVDRVTATDQARAQSTRNANHPKAVAEGALSDAKAELQAAAEEAKAECKTGRGKRCTELEGRETAARQRVADARAKLVAAGAQADEDPAAALFGVWAKTYRIALPLALPIWLEIASPILLGYGFSPLPSANGTTAPRAARVPTAPDGTVPTAPASRAGARKKKGANGTAKRGTNSRAYILDRLDRGGHHVLARAVRAGDMSASMAAVKAGFRKQHLKIIAQ